MIMMNLNMKISGSVFLYEINIIIYIPVEFLNFVIFISI